MEASIKIAKEAVKHNKVIMISEKLFEVYDKTVSIQTKPGRKIMTCTCFNATQYCNEGICWHKIAVMLFLADQKFYQKIDKLLDDYKKIRDLKLKCSPDFMINDLENLRRIK
jgi:hypothetical protein